MNDKVRWAVLGTASIACEKVIPAMQKGEWSEVVGIASRDGGKSQEVAKKLGIRKSYCSYEELLADSEIEAVYIPLPNHLHVPWAIRCAEAGKHVLCEKPVAMNVQECKALMDARDRTGVQVAEAFAVYTHPQWMRVHEMVRSGEIGELRAITASFSYCNQDPGDIRNVVEFGGGALMDIGCYPIKLARWLFGAEPLSVVATINRDPQMKIDRLTSVVIDFGAGHCVFTCGIQHVPHQSVQVLGTKKRIEIPVPFNPHPERRCQLLVDDGSDLWGTGIQVESFELCDHYTIQGDQFSMAVRGMQNVPTPLEDSVKNTAVIEAIFESAKTGRSVELSAIGFRVAIRPGIQRQ